MIPKFIKKPIKAIYLTYARIVCKVVPYLLGPGLAKGEYKRITGEWLNLNHPKNLIEKIIWMQFHTDTSLWTECADKYTVREYVKKCGLDNILPKLYGVWDKPEGINWAELPDKFVLKTNNSCGQIIIVRDKTKLDIKLASQKLKKWLRSKYGFQNAQLHYLRIKPKIIAEELLEDPSLPANANLVDYKIHCFNGEPETCLVVSGRNGSNYYVSYLDLNWNNISDYALNPKSPHYGNNSYAKPKDFDKMLEYAKILSKDIPQVRVDFYDINGKIYFGEMTFTTGYGYRSQEFSEYLGSKIDLSRIPKIR